MSAICGVLPINGSRPHGEMCEAMLREQSAFGPDHRAFTATQDVALGRALFRILPEDRFDVQPLCGGGGRFLMVADIRIDNRDEIAEALGLGSCQLAASSDSALLLAAYERWQEGVFHRLAGNFAVAIWDGERRLLTLARDATGQRPLHYFSGNGLFAFASMPSGLFALSEIPRGPDEERFAEFIAGLRSEPRRTFFKGVIPVEGGHVVTVSASGEVCTRSYWTAPSAMLRLSSPEEYVEAYREQLDRVVKAQLRRATGSVAAHLSSGFDSSAVATTAARLLAPYGERLLAFTAAPRPGFDGAVPRGRVADETAWAIETAAMHPNMDHEVVRGEGSVLSELSDGRAMREEPLRMVCNNLWWRAIHDAARVHGATVLLVGEAGNMTISAGGIYHLSELVRDRRWVTWLAEARALVGRSDARWRGVLAASFGPWMPQSLWSALNRTFLGESGRVGPAFILGDYWREKLASRPAPAKLETRSPKDLRAYSFWAMQSLSPGISRKESLARWGVDERDPTADRRIVEFCLSLPPEVLLSNGVTRAIARRALSDRVPQSVLSNRLRGLQSADWYERMSQAEARTALEQVQDCEAVRRVVNVPKLHQLIAEWPSEGWDRSSVIRDYRGTVLRTLAAATFIKRAAEPSACGPTA
jgi:asparagine synthase (glutamine-hydrolysing)